MIVRSAPEKSGTEMENSVTRVTARIIVGLIAGILGLIGSIGTGVASADEGAQPTLATAITTPATQIAPDNFALLAEASVDQFADENHLSRAHFVTLSGEMTAFSACGFASTDYAYYYCSGDDTVYIGINLGEYFNEGTNRLAASLLIAHEWGHHLQYVKSRNPVNSTVKENGADCVGGAWLKWFNDREGLNLDINDAYGFWNLAGKIGKVDPQDTHGTQVERGTAMAAGYIGGLHACSILYVPVI
jgi:predicted metalloprotease